MFEGHTSMLQNFLLINCSVQADDNHVTHAPAPKKFEHVVNCCGKYLVTIPNFVEFYKFITEYF